MKDSSQTSRNLSHSRSKEFVTQLQHHDKIVLPMLPGAPKKKEEASHDEDDVKHVVFNAMPITWRSEIESNSDCDEESLESIVNCMDKQDKNSKRNSNDGNQNSSQSDDKEKSKQRNSTNDRKELEQRLR